jgi:hypothetical protein
MAESAAPPVNCFTSISYAYLDRARVLLETVRRFHPDWSISIALQDIEPHGVPIDVARDVVARVIRPQDLGIPNLKSWIFRHDAVELCTAVKGAVLCRLLDGGAEKVIYLDPDIAVFAPLDEIVDTLEKHPILLTPHRLEPEKDDQAISDNEIGSLKHGVYNLGFLAVRNCDEGRRFAAWWRDRLLNHCYDNIPGGLFTDQRWCDLVPVFFPGVGILRDPGYNVASWNLGQRPISIDAHGTIMAADVPLRFFHFTKIQGVGEEMLARYAGGRIEPFELVKWYRRRLAAHKVEGLPAEWWGYGSFDSGRPITRAHRVLYRTRPDVQRAYPDPFSQARESYEAWFDADAGRAQPGAEPAG